MQATDRGVWDVVAARSREPHRDLVQDRVLPIANELVERANATGRLRVAFDVNDLPVLLWSGGALSGYLAAAAPNTWWRYIQLMFDSFLSDDDPVRTPIESKAPSFDEIDAAMRGWQK